MKENSETQDFCYIFVKKWRIEICFVVEKINKKKNTKKRLQESTNKELHKKKKLHSQLHFVKDMF